MTGPQALDEATATTRGDTGHPRVDAAVAALDTLDTTPVEEHVEVFTRAQQALESALADISRGRGKDERPPAGRS